ncbi:MAG: glycosyltransferase [Candidatus Promineifilaceae bacterium]|jgi:chlorobactene glucosyltransferase
MSAGKSSYLPRSSTVFRARPRPVTWRLYWTLGFSLAVLPLLARAERRYRDLPLLPQQASAGRLPSLSIIVPARNEARNLRRLLPSLIEQEYPGPFEIIVVDDHSSDETAAVVREFMRREEACLRLLPAAELPDGWLGKPHASHAGARAATGEWLLFTDADTIHTPVSAASVVAFAEGHGLDGLSAFLQQETDGWFNSAVLMVALAGLFAAQRRSDPVLNGQYFLVRRSVYEASGGFAAVRAEMMDDLAYGRHLAQQGYAAPIFRGEALAGVHMYENRRQMWHGINRLGSGSLRYSGPRAFVPALFVTGVLMPLWTLLFNRRYVRVMPRLWLVWTAAILGFVPWAKRFSERRSEGARARRRRQAVGTAVLAPAAALFVQLSALWGMASRLLGRGISWKDRKV